MLATLMAKFRLEIGLKVTMEKDFYYLLFQHFYLFSL